MSYLCSDKLYFFRVIYLDTTGLKGEINLFFSNILFFVCYLPPPPTHFHPLVGEKQLSFHKPELIFCQGHKEIEPKHHDCPIRDIKDQIGKAPFVFWITTKNIFFLHSWAALCCRDVQNKEHFISNGTRQDSLKHVWFSYFLVLSLFFWHNMGNFCVIP